MKKIGCIVLLSSLFLLAARVNAQMHFGAKAGAAFSNQTFTYSGSILEYNSDWRAGIAAGLFAERAFLPNLAVRFEALYVQKGHQIDIRLMEEDATPGPIRTYRHRIDVLSLNLLARGFLPLGTYAAAGPRLDIKVGTAGDFESDAVFQSLEAEYKSIIPGLTAAIGQEFRIGPAMKLFVEGQYYFDVADLYNRPKDTSADTQLLESIRNKSLTVFVGARF